MFKCILYMKRYQVYLNQNSVSVLDEFEDLSNISRSKIIRKAIDNVAEQLIKVFAQQKRSGKKEYILDKLAGFVDLKTNDKKMNFSQHVDEIYFID